MFGMAIDWLTEIRSFRFHDLQRLLEGLREAISGRVKAS